MAKPILFNLSNQLAPSLLEPESCDLVFADPPFNIGYTYDVYKDKVPAKQYLDWCRQWISDARNLLKHNGALWLMIGHEFAAELKCIACHEFGFNLRNWVTWYYRFGVNCNSKFSRCSCPILYLAKWEGVAPIFNRPDILVPSDRQTLYNDSRAVEGGKTPSDVWEFPRVAGTHPERLGWHDCQLPAALVERIVRTSSDPGGLVVDLFAGSGTTLDVCQRLGRQGIGFEISENYCKGIRERCNF